MIRHWIIAGLFFFACKADKKHVTHLPLHDLNVSGFSFREDRLYLNNTPYTGGIFELQPNGKDTLLQTQYRYGDLHGWSRKWFLNGRLRELRCYANGKKHGLQIAYWSNGNKRFEFTACADRYEGILREWSEDGKLLHLATYVNGQEEGIQKMWYDNGKIRANYTIQNGKRYGLLGTKNCKNVSDSLPALP